MFYHWKSLAKIFFPMDVSIGNFLQANFNGKKIELSKQIDIIRFLRHCKMFLAVIKRFSKISSWHYVNALEKFTYSHLESIAWYKSTLRFFLLVIFVEIQNRQIRTLIVECLPFSLKWFLLSTGILYKYCFMTYHSG